MYDFVMVGRLQSDPLERRFSQYRQMSGGRFLVSLREVISSEKFLTCSGRRCGQGIRQVRSSDRPL